MDFENSFIPIWEESPEVYYEPVILEKKLDKIEKEFDEIQYKCSELEKENEILRTEIKTKEKENTDLNNLFKGNTAKLPFYQSKIVELTKEIKELNFDKKNEVMVKDILKKKYEEMKKKTIETVESYMALKTAYKNQEKINEKLKIEKKQDIKNKDRIKAENDKAKTKTDELQIQNKGFKEQLNHYEEELRSKNIMIIELTRRNQILASNIENALTKTNNLEEKVKFLEKKIKTMNKECSESIIKHKSLLYELNALKEKLNDSDELRTTMEGMRGNERSLNKKINTCLQMLAAAKVENEKLIEIAHQLEKKKTRSVCVREDIAPIKRDLQECMTKNMELINKFSNMDCPFYQSSYGKTEDKEPKIKCGSLTERHYENKIFALEQKIKTLHSEINRRDEEHLKYRDVVIKCLYDSKAAKDKLKTTNTLLEKQKYEIIYDKLDVLDKDSKIKKLKIQKNNLDNHLKLYNKQSTLLCKKNRDHILKIESMKKESMRANKIFQDSEQNNDELQKKTEQLEKCTKNIEMQIKKNEKCKKIQQSEVDKLQGSNEELQKKMLKILEDLNTANQKINELTNSISQFRAENEYKHKTQCQYINDGKIKNQKLLIQNKKLIFENKCLSKLKDDNKLLNFKLMTEERRLSYLQRKNNKLFNEKERKINTRTIPEIVVPDLKKSRRIQHSLIRKFIKKESTRNKNIRWKL